MLLPESELYHLYQVYNENYFDLKLPPVAEILLEYSGRLTSSAGICYPEKKIIRLSTHYHKKHPNEVGATLLHEMIHLLVPGHGKEFKRWLALIQGQGERVYRHSRERATEKKYNWVYTCRICSKEYYRQRRLKNRGRSHLCGCCKGKIKETNLK